MPGIRIPGAVRFIEVKKRSAKPTTGVSRKFERTRNPDQPWHHLVDGALLQRTVELYEVHGLDIADTYLVASVERTGVGVVASFDRGSIMSGRPCARSPREAPNRVLFTSYFQTPSLKWPVERAKLESEQQTPPLTRKVAF